MVLGPGMQSHHRSHGAIDFVTLTLDVSDLARVAVDLLGYELTVTAGQVLRPPEHLSAWLLSLWPRTTPRKAGGTVASR
jgi:hypothetical protein